MKEKLVNMVECVGDLSDDFAYFLERHLLTVVFLAGSLWLGHLITQSAQVPKFAMVDVHEINQSFVAYLAQAELTDEQKSQMLAVYSDTLNAELARISNDVVLFSSNQVVTALEDYTPQIKQVISDALLEANRVHKLP